MKFGRLAVALWVASILSLASLATAFAQDQVGVFDLAVIDIESQPYAAGIGDETSYFVTLENLRSSAVPASVSIDLLLTVTDAQNEEVIASCRQPLNAGGLSGPGSSQRIAIEDCSVVLHSPGTHLVRAEIIESGEPSLDSAFAIIPGDLNAGNNGFLSTIVPAVSAGDENLPTELTRIFAGLAIFFAVMALVAAGTEVAIDSVKVAVGLKSKISSMDALDRMEKYMPGELGALSVSATTQEEFRRMIRELRSSLGTTLVAVHSFAALREQISRGEFGTTFERAAQLSLAQETLSGKDLYNYRKYLQAYVNNVLNTMENRLALSSAAIRPIRDQMAQEISLFDGHQAEPFLADLIDDLQDPHFWSMQLVDGWLNNVQDKFYARNSSAVMEEFDNEVKPILVGVGFSPASISSLRLEFVNRLGTIESGMSQSTDTFLSSVRNVLDAVEVRRYDTQSPARKVWRKLRAWHGGSFPPNRLRSTIMPALFLSLFFLYLARMKHLTESPPLGLGFSLTISHPSFSWFIVFIAFSLVIVLLIYFARRAVGAEDKLWFVGLYGAAALSLLIGALITLLIWLLQSESANRVSGQLQLLQRVQPWWSWLVIFSLSILLLMMLASLLSKYVYDRLVRSAVRDGRLISNSNLLANTTLILRVETLWNLVRQGFDVTKVNPEQFSTPDTVRDYEDGTLSSPAQEFVFSPETAAQFIMQRSDQQRDEETSRLRILRVMSIIVGLGIAYALQIDVLNLLGEAFPDVLNQLNWTIVSGETLNAWRSWLPVDKSITVGIILTGFAASAGSAFWHDRLDQLQASKKTAQAAAQLMNQAANVVDTTR